jgi:hypothetical protein
MKIKYPSNRFLPLHLFFKRLGSAIFTISKRNITKFVFTIYDWLKNEFDLIYNTLMTVISKKTHDNTMV